MEGRRTVTDYAAVFAAMPTAYLLLTPDLVIADANPAYFATVGRSRDDLVGRPVFEAFPGNPDDAGAPGGVVDLRASFERARDEQVHDVMPILKYDIPDPSTGGFVERHWRAMSIPVLDETGRTAFILQRAEDVTDYVLARERSRAAQEQGEGWRRRMQEAEADLFARREELTAARAEERLASRRLAALADVALQLAGAESVDDLTTIVIDQGLVALDADGGVVAVPTADGARLELTVTDSLGAHVQRTYAEVPLDTPLPGCLAVVRAAPVVLRDEAECQALSPQMAEVRVQTGLQAWVALPLRVGARVVGSLTVGWRERREFPQRELELLSAFAAQCAQALDRIQVRLAERAAAAGARSLSEALQRSLLSEPPQPDHLRLAVRYLPAAEQAQVGGDWYDAFTISDGSTLLVIGDVAGHDRDAAAGMAQVRNLLRGVAHSVAEPPGRVLSALDRALRDLEVGALATAVLARVEQGGSGAAPGRLVLRWSNAGHPPPVLVRADGSCVLLHTEPDLLLGLDATAPRTDHEHDLEPGDTVLLYTDGLVERRGASLDDGLEWLRRRCAGLAAAPLGELCDTLLGDLGSVEDDVALLALRVHPEDVPRPAEAGPRQVPESLR